MTKLSPHHDETIAFLQSLGMPSGLMHVTGINPDTGKLSGHSFRDVEELKRTLDKASAAGMNLYATYNDISPPLKSKVRVKAKEADVTWIMCLHVDADVDKSITDPAAFEVAKQKRHADIMASDQTPNVLIDSSNGFGCYWYLDKPIKATPAIRDLVKRINIALAKKYDGDAVQDVAHIMRLPGTLNFPDKRKRARGRPVGIARLVEDLRGIVQYTLADFESAPAGTPEPQCDDDAVALDVPKDVDLSRLPSHFRGLIEKGPAEGVKYGDGSRSGVVYHVACYLRSEGFTDGEIVSVIINPNYAISAHILDQKQRDPVEQARRVIKDMDAKGITSGNTAEEDFADDVIEEHTAEQVAEQATIRQLNELKTTKRPEVICRQGELPHIVRQTMRHLMASCAKITTNTSDLIFMRSGGGDLVHLSRNKVPEGKPHDKEFHVHNELLVRSATLPWLTDRAMRAIDFRKPGRKTKTDPKPKSVPCDAPPRVIETLGHITEKNFPVLVGTAECPTLRRDGTVLEAFGYDKATGIFLDTGGIQFPKVKDEPTKADAEAALAVLRDPLQDFPFDDNEDDIQGLSESVALSAMLTSVTRRTLPIAPAYGFDANDVSEGKTTCAQVPAIMMTGRKTGERPFTSDPDEQRKTLSAAFASGDGVLLFDNVDETISGGPLCGAITEEIMQTRRLGGNSAEDQIIAPTISLVMFTGNKLTAAGDMSDRLLKSKLVSNRRRFSDREFKYVPLSDHVIAIRPALVHAALTIMRAYIVAGRPTPGPNNRFTDWRRVVCDPLIWLGLPDPCLAFERSHKLDPVREALGDVIAAWRKETHGTLGTQATTAELIALQSIRHAIIDATNATTKIRLTTGVISKRAASEYLKGVVGVNVEGWRIERRVLSDNSTLWRLQWVGEGDAPVAPAPAPAPADDNAEEDFAGSEAEDS